MPAYDFIIVGLGTAGSATCMTLARRGYRVLGLDKFRPPHQKGSHHGATRSVRRAYLEGTAYVPMAQRAWELWRWLEKESGRTLLVKTPNLTLGPPDCPAVSGFLASARVYDIPHEQLTAAEVRAHWPQLAPPDNFIAGLEKEAGIVFPELSIAALLEAAAKAGANLVWDAGVERWNEETGSVRVHTGRKNYAAGRLLIAAGAWTGELLGLPQTVLTPRRVPVHWIDVPPDGNFHLGQFPVNFWQVPRETNGGGLSGYREFYTLPVTGTETRLKAAFHNGLADCDPAALDHAVSLEETEEVSKMLAGYLPGLENFSMTSHVCLYTMTSDGHFYLGRKSGSQHIFGAALAGHGFKFAPVLGEILADLMMDDSPEFDVELFSPQRFEPDVNGEELEHA